MNAVYQNFPAARTGSAGRLVLALICVGASIVFFLMIRHRAPKSAETAASASGAAKGGVETPSKNGPAAQNDPVRAALDKAIEANVRIQAELDKATSEAIALKAKLAYANTNVEQLQAQIDAGKTEAAGLRGQIEKANNETNGVRAELASAQSQKATLEKELQLAINMGSDVQAKLQKSDTYVASIQGLLARARHLPIHTSSEKVRGSPFELVNGRSSYTLHVNNLSLDPINVDLTILSAGHTINQSNTIAGGATLNIERLAGGAKVSIGSDTYETISLSVP